MHLFSSAAEQLVFLISYLLGFFCVPQTHGPTLLDIMSCWPKLSCEDYRRLDSGVDFQLFPALRNNRVEKVAKGVSFPTLARAVNQLCGQQIR